MNFGFGHERTAVHSFIKKLLKSVYWISHKKDGTYLILKIRDMGYPKKKPVHTLLEKYWDMEYTQKKAVHGVLLKFWDMGYPISKTVHTFSLKFRDMEYPGNIPFYKPVHTTWA